MVGKDNCPLHIELSVIATDSVGHYYIALQIFLPIFSQSKATKASLLSPCF